MLFAWPLALWLFHVFLSDVSAHPQLHQTHTCIYVYLSINKVVQNAALLTSITLYTIHFVLTIFKGFQFSPRSN